MHAIAGDANIRNRHTRRERERNEEHKCILYIQRGSSKSDFRKLSCKCETISINHKTFTLWPINLIYSCAHTQTHTHTHIHTLFNAFISSYSPAVLYRCCDSRHDSNYFCIVGWVNYVENYCEFKTMPKFMMQTSFSVFPLFF